MPAGQKKYIVAAHMSGLRVPTSLVCLIRGQITDTATDCADGFLPEAGFYQTDQTENVRHEPVAVITADWRGVMPASAVTEDVVERVTVRAGQPLKTSMR